MAACAPVDEICNGQDDDCDMRADESFDLSTNAMNCGTCGHACTSGACANGFCTGEQITMLAAGGAHTCAASMVGGLTCWGWNDQDQLGEEVYEESGTPAVVMGVSNVASLAAGGLHTCTVDRSGRCGCFGDGQDGELGRGMTLDSSMLSPVAGASTYATVAAGISTTCAIDGTGALFCWGANDSGQLGVGDTTPLSMPATMVMGSVRAVSMGFQHTCAVKTSGELWCWGSNSHGQIGTGVSTGPGIPIQVPGVSDAIAVACGREFTCLVHMGGAVDCMGANDLGQLGDGTNTPSADLVHVMAITDASSIAAPSAGTHACVVRSTGLLACWGGNASGQLGDGTTMARNAPVMVTTPMDAMAVSAGGLAPDGTGHTCALDHEGRVWCWGDNALGQLGTRDLMNRSRPTLVLGALPTH
jgi:alpha-tubulin suppressor-like RCC1 family protein